MQTCVNLLWVHKLKRGGGHVLFEDMFFSVISYVYAILEFEDLRELCVIIPMGIPKEVGPFWMDVGIGEPFIYVGESVFAL